MLFGLRQPAAKEALSITPMPHRRSRGAQIERVGSALWRMVTLLFVSVVVAIIFAPRAACIGLTAITQGGQYDDLRTAVVAAELLMIGFFILVFSTVFRLLAFHTKLKSDATLEPDA